MPNLAMTFDDFSATGGLRLVRTDRVNILAPDGSLVAGPLTVAQLLVTLGDWIELVDDDGNPYIEGNITTQCDTTADFSQLPVGWYFERLSA